METRLYHWRGPTATRTDETGWALQMLQQEVTRAKQRFGLPKDARVMSCYEAGRDGFWLHRYLVAHDVENLVIDSASIEVNRRQRRAKTLVEATRANSGPA